ncbi:LysR family transcriptional regulator [Azohydromonas aeria]|uniref:LysR family transcriptional regulator n=1 Tax=Azohydromonas aeria TaxID=2590212 RepID=UPI0012F7462F|nr:LysR family transcriptional regulator [Azohydromonas aeria]
MNLKQLEYFIHVAELGSFSKAAAVLDIAQPALSRQVRALELELRETLLLRNGRGVTLTEAGRRLLEHGTGILQAVAQAREDMSASRDEAVGRIVIGVPPTMGRKLTVPLVESFKTRLPRAQLAIVEGLSTHIVEWILSSRVDIGLLYNPEAQPGLEVEPLLSEPLCLVERRDAPSARVQGRSLVPLRELAALPLVLPERAHVIRRQLESQAALAGLKLQIAWEVSSVAAIVELVAAGHGCAVLTASAVAASPRAQALRARPLTDPPLTSVLCLARSATRRPGPLLRQASQLLIDLSLGLPTGGEAAAAGTD